MGAGNSKPGEGPSQHVFTPESSVRFSHEIGDSLQKSSQSDSTRTKQLELQIQNRLTAELERLQQEASSALSALQDKLTSEPAPGTDAEQAPSLAEKIADSLSSADALAEKQRQKTVSSDSVSREVEELRRKLAQRKKLEQLDPAVAKAKEELVQCLRLNDRRPLDCWKEVETFRKEVGRLEREFVEKTVR